MMPGVDPHFQCMSRESASPLSIPRAAIVGELSRELHFRRDSYEGRVKRQKMTPVEAEWQIDIMAAIHADFAADLLLVPSDADKVRTWSNAREAADARLARFRWSELVEALQREIALRRRFYPQMVKDNRMAAIAATSQLERIEAAHFAYWVQARRWWPDELDHKRYAGARLTDHERGIFREAYERHRARFVEIELAPRGEYATPEDDADGCAA